jgi:hypothetical protein
VERCLYRNQLCLLHSIPLESREEALRSEKLLERINNMKNDHTTPETDANAECDQEDGSPFAPVREWVPASFARRLERERDEARNFLLRIARKGEFMDMEGQRLVVSDWLAYRHISLENSQADRPQGSV